MRWSLLKFVGPPGLAYLLKDRLGEMSRICLGRSHGRTIAGGSVIDPVVVDALVARRTSETAGPR